LRSAWPCQALGAGNSSGWLVGVGLVNPTINVTDRWWTARVGAPA
jgi:hypothetical protein